MIKKDLEAELTNLKGELAVAREDNRRLVELVSELQEGLKVLDLGLKHLQKLNNY